MKLKIGISTCPNDTFVFHAILTQKVDLRDLTFDIELLSVQELNERLAVGAFDFSKASFHAALHLSEHYGLIRTGASMGIGRGPLLLAAQEGSQLGPESSVICPGPETTATLLFRCFFPNVTRIEQRSFFDILPALKREKQISEL